MAEGPSLRTAPADPSVRNYRRGLLPAYSGESDQSVRSFRSPSVGSREAADARDRVIP